MKIFLTILIALILVQGSLAQGWYVQPQVVYEQPVQQQPRKPSRVNKILRVLGVALQYAAPIVENNRRATRTIQFATMAVAVTCEIRNCQNGSQYEYGQESYYAANQNIPQNNGNNGYYNGGITVNTNPTLAFASENYGSTNSTNFQNASYTSTSGHTSQNALYITDSPNTFQQDQPSSSLRARVQYVTNRLRQLRAAIRGIRFRRTGPFRWECEVAFKIPGGGEAVCRIKADGTIEGLP